MPLLSLVYNRETEILHVGTGLGLIWGEVAFFRKGYEWGGEGGIFGGIIEGDIKEDSGFFSER